jgi:hypothetical protein
LSGSAWVPPHVATPLALRWFAEVHGPPAKQAAKDRTLFVAGCQKRNFGLGEQAKTAVRGGVLRPASCRQNPCRGAEPVATI